MAKTKRKPGPQLAPGNCSILITLPPGTVTALKAHVRAGQSMSSIMRDLMEDTFGPGKPAPAELDVLLAPAGATWPRVPVYCSEATRDRGVMEVRRRELDKRGKRKPLGIAPAMTWLVVQRFGGLKSGNE